MSSSPAHPAPPPETGVDHEAQAPREAANRPLRMLIIGSGAPGPEGGWVERAAHAFVARGHEVELLQISRSGERRDIRREIPGLVAGTVPPARRLDPRAALALARAIRGCRPDALLAGDGAALGWIARARSFARLPPLLAAKFATGCGPAENTRALGAISVSPAARNLEGAIPVASATVAAGAIPADRTLVRRELRLPRRRELLLQVGRFVPGSGHETTLRALARLRALRSDGSPRFSLVLVGTGPEETHLHVLSHELGLQEHVLWVGHRNDPEPYVQAADVLVVPAAESFSGLDVRAAFAAGTPVVASRSTGARAGIADGETGILVPDGDVEGLAEALAGLLGAPERAVALARAGRDRAVATDSPVVLGHELECLTLAGLVRGAGRGAGGVAASRAAVFLDRDGTLVLNVPYNADPAAVQIERGAAWALRCFALAGLVRVVVSNQSAVARGLCSEEDVLAVNERLADLLRADGADLEAIYFCPHHPDHGPGCDCRKPEPGLLVRAARQLGLDLGRSVTIGDEPGDLEAGRRAGTATVHYSGDWLLTCSTALHEAHRLSIRP